MLGSQAFDLGVGRGWGGGGVRGEGLRFWEMKLMIRTRREIHFQISRSMYLQNPKSGFQNLNSDFPI